VAAAEILREYVEACRTNHSCFLANMDYLRIFKFFLALLLSDTAWVPVR